MALPGFPGRRRATNSARRKSPDPHVGSRTGSQSLQELQRSGALGGLGNRRPLICDDPRTAGLGPASEHALISLLGLNGLRVSKATRADFEAMGLERGHRTLTITRTGRKVVTIPLAPRTARTIDLAIGERREGPVFLTAAGMR